MGNSLHFEITSGPKSGQQIQISDRKTTFGRSELADVILDWDALTSAVHFQVHSDGNDFFLVDLGSTNGTLVNGQKTSSRKLVDGDCVQAGETTFSVRLLSGGSQDESYGRDGAESFDPFSSERAREEVSPVVGPAASTGEEAVPETRESRIDQVRLRVVSATRTDVEYSVLQGQPLTFGRTAHSEVCLDFDHQLSSQHFRLVCQQFECVVEDLQSSNGTWLNGERVSKALVNSGDRLLVGSTEFLVEIVEAARASRASAPRVRTGRNCSIEAIATTCADGRLVRWQGKTSDEFTISDFVERFQAIGGLYLLIDFSRLEMAVPDFVDCASSGLFDWFPPEISEQSPQLLAIDEAVQWRDWLTEGWGKDAIVILASEQDKPSLLAQLRERVPVEVENQRRGINGFCWPVVLSALLQSGSDDFAEELFEHASLVVIEVPGDKDGWQLFGQQAGIEQCEALGMEAIWADETKAV